MNHGIKGRKFNRRGAHRSAMLVNLVKSIIKSESGKMVTTIAKAKEVRPLIEKIITRAKHSINTEGAQSLHHRRVLCSKLLNDLTVVKKLIEVIAPRYQQRPGGYVSIVRAGFRTGDSAEMALVTLVE